MIYRDSTRLYLSIPAGVQASLLLIANPAVSLNQTDFLSCLIQAYSGVGHQRTAPVIGATLGTALCFGAMPLLPFGMSSDSYLRLVSLSAFKHVVLTL